MSGVRLDQKDAALKGGASGKDILPGNSAGSRLIRLVSGLEAKVMPPMGARLTPAEIGLLRAWIDQGAVCPVQQPGFPTASTHWAFQKLTPPPPPTPHARARSRNA